VILVVDDDPSVRASLRLALKRRGHRVVEAADPEAALAAAADSAVELVLQDMNFSRATSGDEGLALLGRLRVARPELPVVLMTAWGSIPLAVAGMRAGAADFLTKPWSNDGLVATVETALGLAAARRAVAAESSGRREALDARGEFTALAGEDPRVVAVLQLVARVAPTDASVLIAGESGTGKELVAEALHANSRRRSGPFVRVNAGGLPTPLFESELFGHVRGAFTDAKSDRKGRFELARGGTLFLDEIGELEPAAQVKLLRVLQERTFEPLGSSTPRTTDARVVSATNRDLAELVARGEFREDLYYRLNLITLRLPPLRERRGDVALLARRFLADVGRRHGRAGLELAPDAVEWLERQSWPGNVRQLAQSIERAVLVGSGDAVGASELAALADPEPPPAAAGPRRLDLLERTAIERSLAAHGGNVTRAAEELGITRQALYRRLGKHGFADDDGSES
jgi:DNA-binding NtrC family response regulator